MTPTGHVMILASAGSGKTHALTDRYVRLLAQGAKPERIVALTFTRKAAGEFFDEILRKLARAAAAPAAAAQLATAIGAPALGAEDFLRLLRSVTDAMHRLRLGTLDGFFAQIVRNFPLELGLAGGVRGPGGACRTAGAPAGAAGDFFRARRAQRHAARVYRGVQTGDLRRGGEASRRAARRFYRCASGGLSGRAGRRSLG
jgi:superfamily I DNA/RNA helicase